MPTGPGSRTVCPARVTATATVPAPASYRTLAVGPPCGPVTLHRGGSGARAWAGVVVSSVAASTPVTVAAARIEMLIVPPQTGTAWQRTSKPVEGRLPVPG